MSEPFFYDKQVLGHSVTHQPVWGHWFATGEASGWEAPLDTLLIGVFHGDEGISGELLDRFVDHLNQHPEGLAGLKDQSLLVIPVLNPDGLVQQTRGNARQVDLNRNFPTSNWELTEVDSLYYSGKSPGSEPETGIVIDLMGRYSPKKVLTVHSPYRVINYDGPAEALAQAISQAMVAENRYPVRADIGYPTPGSFGTYAGVERGIPTITLELPEDESLEQVWQDNLPALMAGIYF